MQTTLAKQVEFLKKAFKILLKGKYCLFVIEVKRLHA